MPPALTRRQQDILALLRKGRFPQPPTLDELCAALGLSSRGSLHKHIQALIDAGYVAPMDGRQRGVRLLEIEANENGDELPLLGRIAAGLPIEAIPDLDEINLADFFTGPDRFVLRVDGDSMIEAGILSGDMVIVEKRDWAKDHEIVVALIDNEEATLKRLRNNHDGSVTLIPANSAMPPMVYSAERVRIQGVVVGQMRAYK